MRHETRLDGVVTPEDARQHYVYLPFEMPRGARQLEVNYHYDNQVEGAQEFNPGNNIDIGVFDTRGHAFQTGGFRGWSGGARSAFSISRDAATPGYLRGPLQAGEWTIMFGLSKIEQPSRYRVNIEVDVDAASMGDDGAGEVPVPGFPRAEIEAPGSQEGRWYRGDLHAHSEHSDGKNTVEEIVDYVRRAGLQYFALTDHNTISHWDELARLSTGDLLLIPGEEITMYGGHANVWALDGWIDFRGTDSDRVRALLGESNKRGSMFSVNHPDSPIPWQYKDVNNYQSMEVWNAPWRYYNEPALLRWIEHLNRGERMIAVGGSDSHCVPPARMSQPNGPGEPCTWVWVAGPLTQRAVLDAVERGHVMISEAPNGPFVEIRADADGDGRYETMPGDCVDFVDGKVLPIQVAYRGPDGKHLRFFSKRGLVHEITPETEDYAGTFGVRMESDDYLRVEVRGFRGRPDRGEVVHALTNPIYWGDW